MAGDLRFKHRYLIGKKRIEDLGFKVIEGKHSLKGFDFVANNPNKRAEDLMESISCAALVVANIGGFDSHKIIPFLDSKKIIKNKTPIIGFSDITSLHLYLYTLGIQTYYGPATLDGFAENVHMHEITKKSFCDVIINDVEQSIKSSKEWTSEFLDWANSDFDFVKRTMKKEEHGHIWKNFKENVEGKLIGGCLDIIYQIKNELFFPKLELWKDSIIFLETSESKMKPTIFRDALISIKELINSSKAIIFGKPKDEEYFEEYKEIFLEIFDKPVIFNLNIGHTSPIYTIPYGGIAKLNFIDKKIMIKK